MLIATTAINGLVAILVAWIAARQRQVKQELVRTNGRLAAVLTRIEVVINSDDQSRAPLEDASPDRAA